MLVTPAVAFDIVYPLNSHILKAWLWLPQHWGDRALKRGRVEGCYTLSVAGPVGRSELVASCGYLSATLMYVTSVHDVTSGYDVSSVYDWPPSY